MQLAAAQTATTATGGRRGANLSPLLARAGPQRAFGSVHRHTLCRASPNGGQQQQQQQLVDVLRDAASGTLNRVGRYMQAPPAGFPPGPPGDQSLGLLTDPLGFITRLRREYGPVVGLLLGGERVVLVADPQAAQQVLVGQPDVFVKAGTAFFPGSSLTGNGLLVSDGDVWRRQRRLSNPAFRKAAVDRYSAAMVTEAQRLLDGPFATAAAQNRQLQQQKGAKRGVTSTSTAAAAAARSSSTAATPATAASGVLPAGVRDVYADFNQLTLNITLSALFSINSSTDSSQAAVFVSAVEKAFTYLAARGASAMVVPEWVPTPDNVAFREAVQQLDQLVYSIIDTRQSAMAAAAAGGGSTSSEQQQGQSVAAAAGAGPPDLLQGLLEAVDETGQPMSRTSLRDELLTLLVAGQETSAILLGWAAALLAHNPSVQAAAAAEVAALLGNNSSSSSGRCPVPGPADIPNLPTVTAVVLEALRLWSPAYMVGRCASRDVQLAGGYQLPAGTTCLVSPYLLHREPTRWKQPTVFKPERWLPLLQPQQQQQQQQPAAAAAGQQQQEGQQLQQQEGQQQVQEGQGCPFSSSSSSSEDSTAASSGCPADASTTSSTTTTRPPGASGGYSFASVLKDMGPNGAYVPFGGGPRNCIGTGFAMTETVLVLAMLLQRYELQPPSPAVGFPRPKPMLTLRPEGVNLRVVERVSGSGGAGAAASVAAGAAGGSGRQAAAATAVAR